MVWKVNLRAIFEEESDSVVNLLPINTFGNSVTLPFVLPVVLGKTVPIRQSYTLISKGPCREIQFKVLTTAGKMHLRGNRTSDYINTMQQET